MNVDSLTIQLPGAQIRRAWDVLRGAVLIPGGRIKPANQIQTAGGSSIFGVVQIGSGSTWIPPFNALLGYVGEANTWIRCGNDHVWIDVWKLVRFSRRFSEDGSIW